MMPQVRNNSDDIEILPPDPAWRAPSENRPVVYDVIDQSEGPDAVRVAEVPPDPRIIGRLIGLGWRLIGLAAVLALILFVFEPFGADPVAQVISGLRAAGWWGRGLVVVGIALLCPLFVPVGPLTLIPGYLFGAVEGTALALLGATAGGLLNFAIARRVLGRHVRAWLQTREILASLANSIDARGFRIVLGLRLSPVMNYGLLSYLSGLTVLKPWRFALAVTLGGLPWTSVYGYAGGMFAASAQPVDLSGVAASPESVALRWFGLALTIALAAWIGRLARADLLRARAERRGSP